MRYRRAFIPGGSFFFTVVTAQRRLLLASADTVEILRAAFRAVRTSRPFEVDAIVVLPDHLHCIWTLPPGDADFATRWRLIKTWFTKHCDPAIHTKTNRVRTARREQAVWQHRYWEHVLRDEVDVIRHVEYVHFNPVKHGFVPSAMGRGHIPAFAGIMLRRGYIPRIGDRVRWISRGWGRNEAIGLSGYAGLTRPTMLRSHEMSGRGDR